MRQAQHRLTIATRGQGLVEITGAVARWVAETGVDQGLLTVFVRHTSASLVIQENASPDVLTDLNDFMRRLVPEGQRYRHASEGQDDMPAHIRAALTQTQLTIPVSGGRALLGTWQGIFLYEHRARPHRREVVLHLLGD